MKICLSSMHFLFLLDIKNTTYCRNNYTKIFNLYRGQIIENEGKKKNVCIVNYSMHYCCYLLSYMIMMILETCQCWLKTKRVILIHWTVFFKYNFEPKQYGVYHLHISQHHRVHITETIGVRMNSMLNVFMQISRYLLLAYNTIDPSKQINIITFRITMTLV